MSRPTVVVENRSESLALNKLRAQNCSEAKGSGNTDGPKRKEKADHTDQTNCNWSPAIADVGHTGVIPECPEGT